MLARAGPADPRSARHLRAAAQRSRSVGTGIGTEWPTTPLRPRFRSGLALPARPEERTIRAVTGEDLDQIRAERGVAQRLAGDRLPDAVTAVGWFGVMQAQDPAGAGWALAQRTEGLSEAEYYRLLDSGALLRTHVLRPTWHLVLPEDAEWMLRLTARRIKERGATTYRRFGIDSELILHAERALDAAVSDGSHLTRGELGAVLQRAGIDISGQRLPHLLGLAELDRVLISGARRGRQPTWAAFAQRVRAGRDFTGDEALAELAVRFFQSHGPAVLADFVWWSGLRASDARRGIAAAAERLAQQTRAGVVFWSGAGPLPPAPLPRVMLLPNWDEFTVAYRDRSLLLRPGVTYDWSRFSFGSILANALFEDGLLAGTWRRSASARELALTVAVHTGIEGSAGDLETAATRFAAYVGLPLRLTLG